MKDLPIVFARMWGWHEARAYEDDLGKAEFLMEHDSVQLYHLFEDWAKEFMQDDEQDPIYFFEEKMRELCAKLKEES